MKIAHYYLSQAMPSVSTLVTIVPPMNGAELYMIAAAEKFVAIGSPGFKPTTNIVTYGSEMTHRMKLDIVYAAMR